MRFSLILVSCSLAGGLLGGCGGSTSSNGSGPVPESQFETRLVNAVCNNISSCCKSAGYAYDANGCKAGANTKNGTVGSKYATYDAQAAGACIDSVAQAMAACKGLESFSAPACNQIFTGTQAAGQPCDNDLACATPADAIVYCDTWSGGGGGGGQGTCVVEPRGKKGDACVDTCTGSPSDHNCSSGGGSGGSGGSGGGSAACYSSDGLYCGGDGTCDALIPIGQPCPYDDGCVVGAYCNSGTCAADKTVGSSCSLFSDICVDGAYCAAPSGSTSGTCEKLKAAGTACTSFDECQSSDCENGKCTAGLSIVSPKLCSGQGGSGGSGGVSGGTGGTSGTGGAFNGSGGVGGT